MRSFHGELKDRAAEKDFNAALLDAENNEQGEDLKKLSFESPFRVAGCRAATRQQLFISQASATTS